MKWFLGAFFSIVMFSGCQSFRYYDPAKPHHGKTRFYNNYNHDEHPSFFKWQWERLTSSKPVEPPFDPPVVKTDTEFLKNNTSKNSLTWVGHSTCLLQLQGVNVLMDPIFSNRASPVGFAGPRRLAPLPVQISELPRIDVVVISHAHYDHLDLPTLVELSKLNSQTIFLVPLGNQELLQGEGIANVQEFDWWEHFNFKSLSLTLVPAQHWSQRTLFDNNKKLWGGWLIQSPYYKVLYTGDTGYSKDFQDIFAKTGIIDLALIPIGAYEPRWFMRQHHVNPEEAVMISQDLHAKLSVGVHWGTFRLADEAMMAPAEDLKKVLKEKNISSEVFRVLKHGETIELK